MAKLESFATLDISAFQRSIQQMTDAISTFQQQLAGKKFEVTLTVNTSGLSAIQNMDLSNVTNSFSGFRDVLKNISGIDLTQIIGYTKTLSQTDTSKVATANTDLGNFAQKIVAAAQATVQYPFDTKSISSISQINLSQINSQLPNLASGLAAVGKEKPVVDLTSIQKLSTMDLATSTTAIKNLASAGANFSTTNFKVDSTSLSTIAAINLTNANTGIANLAAAMKSIVPLGTNIGASALSAIAPIDLNNINRGLTGLADAIVRYNTNTINPTPIQNSATALGAFNTAAGPAGQTIIPTLSSVTGGAATAFQNLHQQANTSSTYLNSGFSTPTAVITSAGLIQTAIEKVITAFVQLGDKIVEEGRRYEDAMAVLEANGVKHLDVVKGALENIRDADLSSGRRSIADYAVGLADLEKAGQTGKDGLVILKEATKLSTTEGSKLNEVVGDLISNLLQFGEKSDKAGHFVDVLAQASFDAKSKASDLSKGLNTVGRIADEAGLSFEETTALLVELDNKGLNAADKGATGLRNVLAAITSPTEKFKDAAQKLGVELKDGNGQLRSGKDVLYDLIEVLQKMKISYKDSTGEVTGQADAVEAASTMFRTRGFATILSLTDKNKELAKSYENVNGTAQRFAETMSNTYTGSIEKLTASAKDAGTNLFTLVSPALVTGMKGVNTLIDGIRNALQKLAAAPNSATQLGAIALAIGAIGSASKIASGSVLLVNGALTALKGVAVALMANPAFLAVAAAVLAVGGAVAYATSEYEKSAAESDKTIAKNEEFVKSLKAVKEEGQKVSEKLGSLRQQEFLLGEKLKEASQDVNATPKQIKEYGEKLRVVRDQIKEEVDKYRRDLGKGFAPPGGISGLAPQGDNTIPAAPISSVPSKLEGTPTKPTSTTHSVTYNFKDINQNITTQTIKPEDMPKLIRNIKLTIQNEFENLGGGC